MSNHWLTSPFGWGQGFQWIDRGTSPAAGAVLSTQLSPRWRHLYTEISFTLTTDSNAANRYVTVEAEDTDGNPFWINGASVTVSANSTQRFVGQIQRGPAEWNTNTDVFFPLSPTILNGGTNFKINVQNIQVGDTLTLIKLVSMRFPTDDNSLPPVAQA